MTASMPDISRLTDVTNRFDPYPVLAEIAQASPYPAGDGLVVVGRHADCMTVLRDPEMSSERDRARGAPERGGPRTRNFLHLDPPDHTRFRRLVTKAFTPRVVARLEPRIRDMTEAVLSAAAQRGHLDIVSDLAYPVPLKVMCELLGVPFEDRDLIQDWSGKLSEALEPPLPGLVGARTTAEAARARLEIINYFRALIEERRVTPRDDLLSYLVRVEERGDQLNESELLATCILLINAGHETTVNLISNGILALLRHPRQLALLRGHPELVDSTVEEVLRYDAPVQLTSRVARTSKTLGRGRVHTGDIVLLLLGAAGRDPAVFDQPDRFDIRRSPTAKHLAFSAGPHFCLGAGLARLEAKIALGLFASRVVRPLMPPDALAYRPNLSLRGPHRLDVTFDDIRLTGKALSR